MINVVGIWLINKIFLATSLALAMIFYLVNPVDGSKFPLLEIGKLTFTIFGLIILIKEFIWRKLLYNILLKFGVIKYPNISGNWEGKVIMADKKEIEVSIVIEQGLESVLVRVEPGFNNKSTNTGTIFVAPCVDKDGTNYLRYLYKANNIKIGSAYYGMTMLRIESKDQEEIMLKGEYFTSRNTVGEIWLKRPKKS